MADVDQAPQRQQLHLRPTAQLAERVLLPGDPGRALALAQSLLTDPRMFNHHRGLWGYTGVAADGAPLTIQSTGMGGPSAAIVLTELIALGARRVIRVGTCGALAPGLSLGELVIARESFCADGASVALGGGERAVADRVLSDRLCAVASSARAGAVVSVDLFYALDDLDDALAGRARAGGDALAGPDGPRSDDAARALDRYRAAGALAVEMESATLFALGARAGVAVACVLAVSDTFDASGARTR
ncbi:MAG TPA: hypothetical protein VEJ23_10515, partial [Solirubrobacteraceae bacterium]|nr:hypothetical protein [Solirubrobacteraceae bacterium]